jgi:hypothetical protein
VTTSLRTTSAGRQFAEHLQLEAPIVRASAAYQQLLGDTVSVLHTLPYPVANLLSSEGCKKDFDSKLGIGCTQLSKQHGAVLAPKDRRPRVHASTRRGCLRHEQQIELTHHEVQVRRYKRS